MLPLSQKQLMLMTGVLIGMTGSHAAALQNQPSRWLDEHIELASFVRHNNLIVWSQRA
jgi:hypothetical protein